MVPPAMLTFALLAAASLLAAQQEAPEPGPSSPESTQQAAQESAGKDRAQAPPEETEAAQERDPGQSGEEPVQGPPQAGGWQVLNRIEIVVNERIMTQLELIAHVQRGERSETVEEFNRRVGEERLKRIETLLEDQAGRDIGFDRDQVKRGVERVEKNRIEALGGASAASDELKAHRFDATQMREQIEESLYAALWREYNQGISPGPGGRVSRDRFVRPGILHMAYEEDPERWGIGPQVVLQQLIVTFAPNADEAAREAVERRTSELRDRILAGDDMDEITEVYGSTKKGTKGLTPEIDERLLRQAYPELIPFLDTAQPGDLSEVLPYVEKERGQIGFLVVRLIRRKPGLGFGTYEVQEQMRRQRLADLDAWRLERGHWRLFQDAYVWPPPSGLQKHQDRPAFGGQPAPGS